MRNKAMKPNTENLLRKTTKGEKMNIVKVNFTFALTGGMWIERENGSKSWESSETLLQEVGQEELTRISNIAYNNGFCGVWKTV
jgi:hypothetical protein